MKEYTTSLFVIAMCHWFAGNLDEAHEIIWVANKTLEQGRVLVA